MAIRATDVRRINKQLRRMRLSRAADLDEDGDAYWGPLVVCPRISMDDFMQCLPILQGPVRYWEYLPCNENASEGCVVINRLPSKVHENAACTIAYIIIKQIKDAMRDSNNLTMEFHTPLTPTYHIGDIVQTPTLALFPEIVSFSSHNMVSAGSHSPFPTIVIEISYKNQKLSALRSKLQRWMNPQSLVQIAIGLKCFANSNRRVAIIHHRGNSIREYEFGDDHPFENAALTFPLSAVFYSVDPLPRQLLPLQHTPIVIDLVCLREHIDLQIARDYSG